MSDYLPPLGWFFQYLFIVTAMAFIGMAAPIGEVLAILRDRGLIIRILLVNMILVPALGLTLASALPIPRSTAIAILLLAVTPGGMNALQFTTKVRGELAFAASVLFLLTLSSLIYTPLVVGIVLRTNIWSKLLSSSIFPLLVLIVFVPLVLGFVVSSLKPALGNALARPLNLISTLSFVAAVILGSSTRKEALMQVAGTGSAAAMLALIAGALVIGWLLGGPGKGKRRVLASTASYRNAGLCLFITVASFSGNAVDLAILVYLLLVIPVNMVFTVYHLVRERRHGGAQRRPG